MSLYRLKNYFLVSKHTLNHLISDLRIQIMIVLMKTTKVKLKKKIIMRNYKFRALFHKFTPNDSKEELVFILYIDC